MRLVWPALIAFSAFAAGTGFVSDVVAIVRQGLDRHQSDAKIASAVHKIDLGERLDWRVIEELESEGAGPSTVTALEMLLDESEPLAPPSAPPFPPDDLKPPDAEQARVLQDAARNSLNYAASLPDFLCTESVRRYEDLKLRQKQDWRLKDTLTINLSYISHAEDYKLTAVNGKATYRTYEELVGALSQGEFGSLLLSIFRDAPRSRFTWDHWSRVRNRPTHVYRFRIPLQESEYNVHFASPYVQPVTARTGQHGFVYVDAASHGVVRVYAEADSLPADFPVTNVYTLLDYDYVDISGHSYLLPIRALVRMGTNHVQTRNEMAFEKYRKFTGEANITFK